MWWHCLPSDESGVVGSKDNLKDGVDGEVWKRVFFEWRMFLARPKAAAAIV